MSSELDSLLEVIEGQILKRIDDFEQQTNIGPGGAQQPITQITLGFELEQPSWITLVFDSRTDAEIDGEWNSYIEENILDLSDFNCSLPESLNIL